jgi:porphobilinogen synthase
MVRETYLSPNDLIMPYFLIAGKNIKQPIKSMPEIMRLSIDKLIGEIKEVESLGIPAILLFGIPQKKDKKATEAYNEKGIVQQAIQSIKKEISEIVVITDVCLCSYTSHGHCGVVKDGRVDNDETIKLLAKTALSHAEAGADIVAPSAMMDGQVKAIREVLDENNFIDIAIMSYAGKYASSFYGPFREAADSVPKFGDRKTYQMDPANVKEAIREIKLDIEEGADIVMVKPALSYLDVIYQVKEKFGYPVAAYNVSGEYSMIKAASKEKWINEKEIVLEILTSIKRAGADMILTYYAKEVAKWIREIRV